MPRTPKATKPEAVQTTLAVQRDLRRAGEGPHLLPWMKAFAVWMATHAGLHHPTQAEQLAFIEDRTGARLSPRLLRKMRVRPAFIEYYHALCHNVEEQAMEEFKNHLPEYVSGNRQALHWALEAKAYDKIPAIAAPGLRYLTKDIGTESRQASVVINFGTGFAKEYLSMQTELPEIEWTALPPAEEPHD